MLYTIVVYDDESNYAYNLMNYIKAKYKKLNVHGFTNGEHFKEFASNHEIDLLLINHSLDLPDNTPKNIKKICILWDGMKNVEKIKGSYPILLKYQSAKHIVKEVMSYLPSMNHEISYHNREHTKVILVYSMDNKKIQSALAYSLAKEYSKSKKILYINLHSIQILPKLLHLQEESYISQLIYYLKQKNPQLKAKLNKFITKLEEIDILYGVSVGFDLYDLTESDMKMWINEMVMWSEYEIILFDVGNITKAILALLSYANETLVIKGVNEVEQLEMDELLHQLEYTGLYDIIKEIKVVEVPDEILKKTITEYDLQSSSLTLLASNTMVNKSYL